MKKIALFICALWGIATGVAHAETRPFGIALLPDAPPKNAEFAETEDALPPVPLPEQGEWLPLYVNETHRGQPFILLDSLKILPDRSVRYLFNQRSASGYNNITAEGIVCAEGIFNSDGMLHKIFAYADLSTPRWIVSQNSKWQTLGGKSNAKDPVRRVLYEVMCTNNKILNEKQLRQALIEQGAPSRLRSTQRSGR